MFYNFFVDGFHMSCPNFIFSSLKNNIWTSSLLLPYLVNFDNIKLYLIINIFMISNFDFLKQIKTFQSWGIQKKNLKNLIMDFWVYRPIILDIMFLEVLDVWKLKSSYSHKYWVRYDFWSCKSNVVKKFGIFSKFLNLVFFSFGTFMI
jgi:hypothetical protein